MEPLQKSFPPHKAREWHFKIHPYFTKQASNVVAEYVKYYTSKGDIILDPFSGTGVTSIESLQNKRRTIAVDLSPLACFITRQSCFSPLKIELMLKYFRSIKEKLEDTVEFVKTASDVEIDKTEITEWYPKKIKLPKNADFEFVEDLFHPRQMIVLAKLLFEIKKIKETEIRDMFKLIFSNTLGKTNLTYMDNKARGPEGGGSSVFGKYRYWRPKSPVVIDVWKNFESRFSYLIKGKKQSNISIGNYFKEPNQPTFESFQESEATFWCINGTATNLELIPDSSIDYIYTDPPYGAHIAYLDLSTMWLAWLEMLPSLEQKKMEVIEGGDLEKSRKEYNSLLFESIAEMSRVLKPEKWLSIVFQHKDVELWHSIHDAALHTNFNYVNTVFQPTNTTSIHKKKNPLVVMGSQLIINFQRTKKAIISNKIELKDESETEKIILDIAERVIVEKSGYATTEDIYATIVPHLMEVGLLHIANKRFKNLIPLLEKFFVQDSNNFWQIKKGSKLGYHIPKDKKIEYFLRSVLLRKDSMPFDEIIAELMVNLINGSSANEGEILEVLKRIGKSDDQVNWSLKEATKTEQFTLFDEKVEVKRIPKLSEHNNLIFSLATLGANDGFLVYIGKKEQSDKLLVEALKKYITNYTFSLPFSKMNSTQKRRIEQIDCIFCHKDGTPFWAFEIENSTSIVSALQRFKDLLEVNSEIGNNKRLIILAPEKRMRKLNQELSTSTYIGHPLYFETKIRWTFFEEFYKTVSNKHEWKNIFRDPKF